MHTLRFSQFSKELIPNYISINDICEFQLFRIFVLASVSYSCGFCLFWLGFCSHPHSSTLAWKIPWTEEPGRLQSIGSLRVGQDWAISLSPFTFMHWRRKWQPTPVFLPGESQGRESLVGCRLWGHTESDTTERLHFHFSLSYIGEGNGTPLQYSCLENPMDRGAW